MKRFLLLTLFAGLMFGNQLSAQENSSSNDKKQDAAKADATPAALNFKMKSIDGKEVDLSKYKGKVVLIVNTASKCGFTPQYEQLQSLHEQYSDQGLSILGFPCNQFGGQEPGTEKEIAAFCKSNFGVEFDMFAKVDVKGKNRCELYKHLTSLKLTPKGKGDVRWNFEKFLLNRDGQPIARFGTKVSPDDEGFIKVIKNALAN